MEAENSVKVHLYLKTDGLELGLAVANKTDLWEHISKFTFIDDDEIEYRINCAKDIQLVGPTKCIERINLLTEEIIAPGIAQSEAETLLKIFIDHIVPSNKVVIIDPYLLAGNTATDVARAKNIFDYLDAKAAEIHIVSEEKATSVKAEIQRHANVVNIVNNKEFHDRFWISLDTKKGFVVGTSLNGIGNRYCLIDYLSANDVAELIAIVGAKFGIIP